MPSTKLAKGTRVITIQQPWATLVALGEKPVEYRTWPTAYRGPLAISSSKAFPKYRREDCETPRVKKILRKHRLSAGDLPRGKVLCVRTLLDCRLQSDGNYGFVLGKRALKVFNPPIAMPPGGMHLGLWKW
jgi:activating signal cointegrator 1